MTIISSGTDGVADVGVGNGGDWVTYLILLCIVKSFFKTLSLVRALVFANSFVLFVRTFCVFRRCRPSWISMRKSIYWEYAAIHVCKFRAHYLYDAIIVYFMMRRITVKVRRHASLLDSGLLRSNKDDRLITRHSPGGILSSWTHWKYWDGNSVAVTYILSWWTPTKSTWFC